MARLPSGILRRSRGRHLLLLCLPVLAAACGSDTGGPAPADAFDLGEGSSVFTGGGTGSLTPGSDGGSSTSTQKGGCERVAPGARAVWMNARQYERVLQDLVGDAQQDTEERLPGLESDLDVLDRPWVTTAVLDRVMREAEQAAQSLRGRTAAFLECPDLGDDTCVRAGLAKLAGRAYVRAPEPSELDALMALRAEALSLSPEDGQESAVLTAVQAILAAPSTLYRVEFSQPEVADSRSLSSHERAAQLAAFLLDSVPDEPLLAAAENGSLASDQGLRAQVSRLLTLPRVRHHLTGLLLNGYRVTRVFESPKDDILFPDFGSLTQSMFEESRRFVDDVVWTRSAPVSELLVGTTSFVDAKLATLYGVALPTTPGADEFVPITLPAGRAGLLTQASVLSGLSRTDKTSVVARGLFVRRDLLCLPKVPAPPASVQAQITEQLTADASEVELAEYRAQTEPCNSCHKQFDRFGLAMEGFDPIGRTRTPAPAPIDLQGLEPLSGVVASPEDLVQLLVEDDRFTHCMAERLMDYALRTTAAGDAYCDADALHQAIDVGDGSLAAVVEAIVTHPAFTTRTEETP